MSESLTYAKQLDVIHSYAVGKKNLVEVGVCFGGTSRLLRTWMSPEGTLHLVDPFPLDLPQEWKGQKLIPSLAQAQEAVNSVTRGSVEWYIMTSAEAAKGFKSLADFIFIDGLHDEDSVKLDWSVWAPHVAKDGVVLFHDVAHYCPGVLSAWQSIKRTSGWECLGLKQEIGIMKKL